MLFFVATIQPLRPNSTRSKSEILYGAENAVRRGVYFMSNVKERMDISFDHRAPSIVIELEAYKNGYMDIRKRGGKIRALTEITKDNLQYCKELMKIVDELRHLDGVKGGLAVSETEYMATTVLQEAKPLTQVIYSNVNEVVEQGQYFFDTIWSKGIPAKHRIKEIEEGVVHYETRIIENSNEIIKEIGRLIESSNQLSTCLTVGGMQYSYNHFVQIKKKLVDKQKKGKHKGIRYISTINNKDDDLKLAKIFLDMGIQLRHLKNLPPMSFGVSDKEIAVTIESMEDGKVIQSLLLSNEPFYVKHFTSIFEDLWKKGVDVVERIMDIEKGIDLADIEVIPNSARAQEIYLNIVKSATEEILLIFPTIHAFIRQEKIGVIELLKEGVKERNVKVRILVPTSTLIEQKIQQLQQNYSDNIDFRYIEQMPDTKATILVVDRKVSLVMELRDDSKTTFFEAIGLSTYSNSKAGVLSYVAIFENLWVQTELYEQLKKANEQLKVHDKMQHEFINVAAHELRNPIQPILGLSQILRSKKEDTGIQERLLDVIIRNAKRLQKLTEDILDVTRIESQSLHLNKEQFKVGEMLLTAIADSGTQVKDGYKDDNIKFELDIKEDILVEADRNRVNQVISNLLNNAIKFTKQEGIISMKAEKKDNEVIISVKDNGRGIDPQIIPRLFTKFATKSDTGTGLGLFISKSIVEAQGGRIRVEK